MNSDSFCSLAGKRALVTGSGRGIGRAAAMLLARGGAHVIFHASAMNDTLRSALAEAQSAGLQADAVPAALGDSAALGELVRKTGPVDILVLNASVQKYMRALEYDEAEFLRTYQTNLASSFRLVREYLPAMLEKKWGRVIAVGSVNQWKPSPRLPVYASCKAAQANFILGLAREYADCGVTFNNVAPGIISTDRNKVTLADPETAKTLLKQVPSGFFGAPEDCAGIIRLLASEEGRYINGADIPVAGGMQI